MGFGRLAACRRPLFNGDRVWDIAFSPAGRAIEVAGVSADDRSAADCNYTGNWLWIEPGTSYTATLEIRDGTGTLTAKGAGQNKGRVKYEGPYTILWVGAASRGDRPEYTGVIERMVVEPLN